MAVKIVRKQLFGRVEDCKTGIAAFEQANEVLKHRMNALKEQQQQSR